ncbi:odv-e25 [Hemileuca sp. nucleopolyhedrovirus]|uniref:Odv-e25 n=1 Tax=Hemileuca sp. nucleopolyhedrovirus TaxID=1367203 RepID=S5N392_9ABAC|nr:odv-e25 [Hemileuca sp. nucleopolyhedrovirus]AGR56835.1 odv-e25 [Hemileuca sp. nucleopolyhedrovirus]
MIGVIILIIVILAVLYFLSVNNKLNSASITDMSPSLNESSDSVQMNPQTGQYSVKLNNPRVKSLRVTYDVNGSNRISKIFVAERPMTFNEIIDEGNRSIGTNCVFVGTLVDDPVAGTSATGGAVNGVAAAGTSGSTSSSSSSSSSLSTRTTANFDVKQFKNIFIVFKNLDAIKTKESINMVRYESEGMSYFFIDPTTTIVPEIRDISYPITIYTTNSTVQQKLNEWNYVQINDSGTLYIKNHRSFRIQ